jgi:hypothetical protein
MKRRVFVQPVATPAAAVEVLKFSADVLLNDIPVPGNLTAEQRQEFQRQRNALLRELDHKFDPREVLRMTAVQQGEWSARRLKYARRLIA